MKLDRDIFSEIMEELDDDNYADERRKIILDKRLAIKAIITTKPTATDFAIMAAAIFKAEPKLPVYTQHLLEFGILIGYMYKEKELTKDADKRRLIT